MKNLKKQTDLIENWGTEDSYFPFKTLPQAFTEEDVKNALKLTPSQRVEWLLMMQKLLIEHFQKKPR